MTDTPTPGATRPATITDADLFASVHDLGQLAETMMRVTRRIADELHSLTTMMRRWNDAHGIAYRVVVDELENAATDPHPRETERVDVRVELDTREFEDAMRRVERAMRDMARAPIDVRIDAQEAPTIPFPGALPASDDLVDILTRLDAVGDDGVPCPDLFDASAGCEWCNGTGRVDIPTLVRYIAETGRTDSARAVLGLRPLATVAHQAACANTCTVPV